MALKTATKWQYCMTDSRLLYTGMMDRHIGRCNMGRMERCMNK